MRPALDPARVSHPRQVVAVAALAVLTFAALPAEAASATERLPVPDDVASRADEIVREAWEAAGHAKGVRPPRRGEPAARVVPGKASTPQANARPDGAAKPDPGARPAPEPRPPGLTPADGSAPASGQRESAATPGRTGRPPSEARPADAAPAAQPPDVAGAAGPVAGTPGASVTGQESAAPGATTASPGAGTRGATTAGPEAAAPAGTSRDRAGAPCPSMPVGGGDPVPPAADPAPGAVRRTPARPPDRCPAGVATRPAAGKPPPTAAPAKPATGTSGARDPAADEYPSPAFDPVRSRHAAALQEYHGSLRAVQVAQNFLATAKAALAAHKSVLAAARAALAAAEARLASQPSDLDSYARRLYMASAEHAVSGAVGAFPSPASRLAGLAASPLPRREPEPAAAGELERLRARVAECAATARSLTSAVRSRQRELALRQRASSTLRSRYERSLRAAMGRSGPASTATSVVVVSGLEKYAGGRFVLPVRGPVSSVFGNRLDPYYHRWQLHAGMDLVARDGTPILAAAPGVVVRTGWFGGYGNYTCVEHGLFQQQRLITCYGHQSRILIAPGDRVRTGQVIGLVGTTGASTGAHLHFEVRLGGRPVDPAWWL